MGKRKGFVEDPVGLKGLYHAFSFCGCLLFLLLIITIIIHYDYVCIAADFGMFYKVNLFFFWFIVVGCQWLRLVVSTLLEANELTRLA